MRVFWGTSIGRRSSYLCWCRNPHQVRENSFYRNRSVQSRFRPHRPGDSPLRHPFPRPTLLVPFVPGPDRSSTPGHSLSIRPFLRSRTRKSRGGERRKKYRLFLLSWDVQKEIVTTSLLVPLVPGLGPSINPNEILGFKTTTVTGPSGLHSSKVRTP